MKIFWPALFALGGTKQQEAEYAALKGQADALEQTSIEKKCAISAKTKSAANPSTVATSDIKDKN